MQRNASPREDHAPLVRNASRFARSRRRCWCLAARGRRLKVGSGGVVQAACAPEQPVERLV
eukprot:611384-Prymnesium_polylepis.2